MTAATQLKPYALSRDEGQAIWFLGTLFTVKATGEQTGGAYMLIEELIPAGFGPPPHVHHVEEEAFYVLEGELTVTCGEQTWQAGPGSYVFLPRGIVHGFAVTSPQPARVLQFNAPAGFEKFAAEMGEPARVRALPPMAPPDLEKLLRLAAKHNIELKLPPAEQ